MKYKLFRKNHRNFKNYILMGSLVAVTLFNGTTQAMDDPSRRITPTLNSSATDKKTMEEIELAYHTALVKKEKKISSAHYAAIQQNKEWVELKSGTFTYKNHSVANQMPNQPTAKATIPWERCSGCLRHLARVKKKLALRKENQILNAANTRLLTKTEELDKERETLTQKNEELNTANALLENKVKDLILLPQKNEELNTANARLLAKTEELEKEREAIYNSTAEPSLALSLVAIMEASEVNVSHLDVNDPAFGEKCLRLLLQKKFG